MRVALDALGTDSAPGPEVEGALAALEADGVPVEFVDALGPAVERHLTGNEQVFVYGFQGFVTDAIDAIEAAGGDPDDAKIENYG